MNTHTRYHRFATALGLLLLGAFSTSAQLPPDVVSRLQNTIGSRIEAMTILGGDYGVAGATYNADNNDLDISISKFGGMGDVGDPRPLGDSGLKWQPRLQGNMGYLTTERDFDTGLLAGDKSENSSFAIQFGGGARFWFTEHLSLTPTIMGMYGHSENDYSARSAFSQANKDDLEDAGLIDWDADTWTVRPAAELSYLWTWKRTVIEIISSFAYFHTEDFNTSSSNVSVDGDSETWQNKIDVDIPLGVNLFKRELHTGGFFSRTEFLGDIEDGIQADHLYEAHGRLVLDFLGKLWKVKWIGLGGSYLWGNNFDGWSAGLDVAFKF